MPAAHRSIERPPNTSSIDDGGRAILGHTVTYRVKLPIGGRRDRLDIIEPHTTAVQRFIRRKGLGSYEPSTTAAMLALGQLHGPGFTFVDIGANMGLYSALMASMFEPRSVHAFEPTPNVAQVARMIMERNNLPVEVFESAVSDTTGVGTLQLSSVSDASNSMVEGFRVATGVIDVATVRLDDHVRRSGIEPTIVKVDVETFEPAVLRGAAATIARYRPALIVEVLNRRRVDHGVQLTDIMSEHGYVYYQLSDEPTWEPQSRLSGSGTTDRDWLLTPDPLDVRFPDSWATWQERLRDCDVESNPRVPLMTAVREAHRRGGFSEIFGTARRVLSGGSYSGGPRSGQDEAGEA